MLSTASRRATSSGPSHLLALTQGPYPSSSSSSSSSSCTVSSSRSFSASAPTLTTAAQQVQMRFGKLPPYPYGPRLWYKKSNFGLFGSARVRFGNNVSEQNEIKTRRRWYPNVQRHRLWSEGLGRFIRVQLTTRVLRSVDKAGGIDEYLLGEKAQRVKDLGPGGWAIRWRLMRSEPVRERYRRQRVELGLPEPENARWLGAGVPGSGGGASAATEIPVPEEDVGLSEAELKEREAAIDRVLDQDAEREAKGLDGGIELEALDELEETEGRTGAKGRRRW